MTWINNYAEPSPGLVIEPDVNTATGALENLRCRENTTGRTYRVQFSRPIFREVTDLSWVQTGTNPDGSPIYEQVSTTRQEYVGEDYIWAADFPVGATRQTSVRAIPPGTLTVRQAVGDTGQPIPGQYAWDTTISYIPL